MKCVYGIINIKNGKKYIGSTINFSRRKKEHLTMLRNNWHHSPYLQHAWNKYGETCFKFIILEKLKSEQDCYIEEQKYLDEYKTFLRNYGYNMSEFAAHNNYQTGKPVYQLSRNGSIIAEFNSLAEAAIQTGFNRYSISACANNTNNFYKNYLWMFKKDYNEETVILRLNKRARTDFHYDSTKEKMSVAINKSKHKFSRPVLQYTLDNFFIKEYPSVREAARQTGTNAESLVGCCKGKYKTGNGFLWKYKNPNKSK